MDEDFIEVEYRNPAEAIACTEGTGPPRLYFYNEDTKEVVVVECTVRDIEVFMEVNADGG